MKTILRAVLVLMVAAAGFVGLGSCAAKKAEPQPVTDVDSVIAHYQQRRSDLTAQRGRLVETYGPDSLQVASIDRQIALVDQAVAVRHDQLSEQEKAREELRRMKQEASASASQAAASSGDSAAGSAGHP